MFLIIFVSPSSTITYYMFQLTFGLAMILPLDKNVRFGMLCVACVPGGGIGHVAVIISKADLPLSITMNLISTVTMLGKPNTFCMNPISTVSYYAR